MNLFDAIVYSFIQKYIIFSNIEGRKLRHNFWSDMSEETLSFMKPVVSWYNDVTDAHEGCLILCDMIWNPQKIGILLYINCHVLYSCALCLEVSASELAFARRVAALRWLSEQKESVNAPCV